MRSISLLVTALVLAGCTSLAPDYQRPAAPVPAAWPGASAAADGALAEPLAWQQFFTDARLRTLIGLALQHNRDLGVAALNIERARALHRIERADRLPSFDAGLSSSLQRTPAGLAPSGRAETIRRHDAAIGISSYELDFFGRVRSLDDAALQQFLATEEARRSAQISLVAEVASAWLELAADRERQRLARETLDNQRSAHTLIRHRVESGVASQIDLRRAQTTVDSARADLARFTTRVAQHQNALALLVGAPLSAELLPESLAPVAAQDTLPAGVPSQLLQRRPDIRAAEHRLMAANAHIGAARAAFFPSVTLTASGGVASRALGELFQGGAGAWAFVPQIVLPIFDGGRRRAALDVAQVDRDIAIAHYEAAIQRAFRDVADALAQRGTMGEQLDAQQSLVAATADAFRLSDIRFRQGAQGYLEVLDAQREMVTARQALIGVQLARLTNQVTLYRTLGGGWA
ncbi:efflux transporter outer membrane subunit [Aquincola sp. S2]|uniref:Efflux transporter outer membrane subunit n=1 Tax=Pseudaquabacterium terrae TaxID=2732868 RepID=A0ABX2EF93_9BURK|nr:efflux transporter outer membrane subunit [Aquabacterium terrae]NRF67305.1 efflux transporter outer membrane subunit [Aquabacterium terrae]